MATIDSYQCLSLGELAHQLGDIDNCDLESTQNALIILVGLVQEQAAAVKVLEAEVKHHCVPR